ncbi:dynamin family protein [Streptomyces sp. NPDC058653]|uniref:dynamin family protein n=1 Tax=Streptomyces sp. NPDC058653 TaxID=3346576 RepID=UPI003665F1F4
MSSYESLRSELLALFDTVTATAETTGAAHTAARLHAARRRLTEGRLTVAVCGEFKRGKSTLLNALLGEPDLLPTDTVLTTRLVTTVEYGATEEIAVVLEGEEPEDEPTVAPEGHGGDGPSGDPGQEEPRTVRRIISRSEIRDYVTEAHNPHNARRALQLEIRTPNPRLESGIRWVDTPGVGGMYEEHTAVALAFLPQADALLFVADATQPLTQHESDFIKTASDAAEVDGDTDAQIFVLTKTDLVGAYDQVLAALTDKVVKATGRPAGELTIVPVSARARLDHLADGDTADWELSNFAALEAALWAALNRRRTKVLLGDALTALGSGTQALIDPVDAAIDAQRRATKAELGKLRDDYVARQGRLEQLGRSNSLWRSELTAAMNTVRTDLRGQASAGLNQIWLTAYADYLYQKEYLKNPDALVRQISLDAAGLVATLNETAGREAARILREFTLSSGLSLGSPRFTRLPDPPVPPVNVRTGVGQDERPHSLGRRVREVTVVAGAGGVVGAGTGAGVGALLGTLFLPGAGTAVGAQFGAWAGSIVGALFGAGVGHRHSAEEAAKQEREAERGSLKETLAPLRKSQETHLRASVDALVAEMSTAVVAELESRITQERESVNASLVRIRETYEAQEQDAEQRVQRLQNERIPLQRTLNRLQDMGEEATRPGADREHRDEHPGGGDEDGAGDASGEAGS